MSPVLVLAIGLFVGLGLGLVLRRVVQKHPSDAGR